MQPDRLISRFFALKMLLLLICTTGGTLLLAQSSPQAGLSDGQQQKPRFIQVEEATVEDLLEQGKLPFYRNFNALDVVDGEVVILDSVHFEMGKAVIIPSAYSQLDNVVTYLNRYPYAKIEIQGHTDNSGPADFNIKFSMDRANSVKNYLVSKGIKPARIFTIGFGESRPRAPNRTTLGRDLNRRIAIRVFK